MSNEQPPVSVTGKADILLIMAEGEMPMPICVVPSTQRAIELFKRWGMDDDVDGIKPPDNVTDLLDSIPADWVIAIADPQKEKYNVQKITLPQPLIVLH